MSFLFVAIVLNPGCKTVGEQSIVKVALCYSTPIPPLLTLLTALMPEDQGILCQAYLLVQLHLKPHLVHEACSLQVQGQSSETPAL